MRTTYQDAFSRQQPGASTSKASEPSVEQARRNLAYGRGVGDAEVARAMAAGWNSLGSPDLGAQLSAGTEEAQMVALMLEEEEQLERARQIAGAPMGEGGARRVPACLSPCTPSTHLHGSQGGLGGCREGAGVHGNVTGAGLLVQPLFAAALPLTCRLITAAP